ncbi:MAB_1171c family putative transporter [Gandjariella thermophila]|uniref:DUF6545 domain-containing protein n=1 Tax=Gandjariella thermophila TaxID=1931992 RepID=A0A4D4J4U5_9PSEU|nr:MAB_1171c family putative transporter [Gandjariella thermophila]GDY30484.1 hypothetical protein GTS_21170 [Gandjariella thermophila]
MKDIIFPICAVASWITFLYKASGLLRPLRRNPALVVLCVNFALLGAIFTVSTPAVSAALDAILGLPNVAAFCIHMSVVAYSFAVQAMLLFWTYPPALARLRVRRRLLVLGPVLATMVTLFVLAGARERYRDFLLDNAGRPLVTAYLLFYVVTLAVALVVTARMSWQFARLAGRPWLRRGLRLNTVGAITALGYCAVRVADVVGTWAGANPGAWEFLVPLFAGAGTLVTICGLTLPAWGPRLSALYRWVREYRTYHRLYPLWAALYRAVPAIALHPPASRLADRLSVRDLDLRLYRRVIEIHDGRLALRPWFDPDVAATAERQARLAGLTGEELAATVEAAKLAAALRARAAGRPTHAPAAPAADPAGRSDLRGETDRLVRVATAFRRSPVVAAAARAEPGTHVPDQAREG